MVQNDELILLEKKVSISADTMKKNYQDLITTLNTIRLLSLENSPIDQCENCKTKTLQKCKETMTKLGIKTD